MVIGDCGGDFEKEEKVEDTDCKDKIKRWTSQHLIKGAINWLVVMPMTLSKTIVINEDDDKIKRRTSAGDKVYVDEETATDDNDRSKIGSGRFH